MQKREEQNEQNPTLAKEKQNAGGNMKQPDMKDIAIIDGFPIFGAPQTVLNVGCGTARIDFHLAKMGYRVYATDIKRPDAWENTERLSFHTANVFDLASFPVQSAPIVICSQVLEHLENYQTALINLLKLTEIRLIITIPFEKSFNGTGHCNFWNDRGSGKFKDIHEFEASCSPYAVAISKMRTKLKDMTTNKYNYLIMVDKRQDIVKRASK